jgi:hypothetical protein
MLTRSDLRRIARTRLRDAEVLFHGRRYDGAVYLCGYAVELALKARICATLQWPGFPEKSGEFTNLQSFKTHNIDVLLHLTGREDRIRLTHLADWSVVAGWDPESMYKPPGAASRTSAQSMLESTRRLLRVL